jgi:hypothetical protein
MTRMTFLATLALPVAAAVAITAAGCSGYNDTRGIGDAPVQQAPKPTWLVIPAPDGFGNVATVCNPAQKGTRLYIVTHDKADVQPLVQADEACR